MLAKKKKKAKKVQRRFNKEKEINCWVWGGESQSNIEAELELEEPTKMGDDTSVSEDEGDRGAAMTLVERHEPTAVPVGGVRDTEMRNDIPESRKRAVSGDALLWHRWLLSPCSKCDRTR